MGDLVAFAADDDPAVVKNVTVTRTYKDINQVGVMFIEVNGTNLSKLGKNPVIVRDEIGNPSALSTIVENDYKLHYKIENPKGISRVSVNENDYDINSIQMPIITSIEPLNRMVSNAGKLTINGNGFKDKAVEIRFISGSGLDNSNIGFREEEGENGEKIEKLIKGFLPNTVGGPYRLEFKRAEGNLIIEDNYPNLFTVYGELGISDDITMVPNQGPAGTEVKIKGKELTKQMSAFFLKDIDGSDPYTVDNRGIFVSYGKVEDDESKDKDKTIDVYTLRVPPKLEQGRYYVVLTNDVNGESDLEGKIISRKLFSDNIFTVIDNRDTISVTDVEPPRGPETGVDAIIQGRYIGTLSPNVFTPNDNSKFEMAKIDPASNILKVDYNPKNVGESIGRYKLIGGKEGVDVTKIEREITVFIGNKATFREGSVFTKDMDKLNIKVSSINLQDGEDPAKPVKVDVTTTIYYEENGEKKLVIREEGTWKNKFIFQPINYKPRITSIIPDIIPVDANNNIADSFKISIVGENFLKYRYTNDKGEVKVKQPVIDLGGQIILDPNISEDKVGNPKRIPVTDMKIFNKSGVEIDGTVGNDLGNKILVTVPKGEAIDPNIIDIISRLIVTNPIKNNQDIEDDDPNKHLGLSGDGEIKFIKVTSDKTPFITNVTPDTITTSGEKGIIISGQNFAEKFTLYMDGEKITSAKRNGTGTQITFDAPPKPEGYVQLIVQNDDGALATYDKLLYVKTYTDPKIIDFNPKKGTANTLVDLKGQNLVPPNPLVKELDGIGFMKLVGTRVFIGGKDINTYTTNNTLEPYEIPADKPLISARDNTIIPSDYYHSIILEDNGTYYKIYFDTISGKYYLTDGDKDVYEIIAKEDKLFGKKGGDSEQGITVKNKQIELDGKILAITEVELDGKTLTIKTPYSTEAINGVDTITGNRVKVTNGNELYFEVPPQPREGYYDIAIVNPDTKKDERKGNAGFYYFFQPGEEPPKIKDIEPSEGSTEGQYDIFIDGENFVDRGTPDQKTSVIIGGIVVPSQDIEVSPDGKTMKVKVPKYPGDLSNETDMDRKYVNVVVINPDGGSDRRINGFAYIIPISHPQITKLILNKGSAAGGDIVTIEGRDFRYFEPFRDANNDGIWNDGETFTDKNGNKKWDDLRKKDVFDDLKDDWDNNILPILPTVYFGGKIATIKSFTASTIDVEVPKGVKGPVEVYLVNNDYGVSNKLTFTYEASNPKINSITPNTGKKQGGDKLEILGEGFIKGDISVYNDLNSLPQLKEMVQIQFGNPNDENMTNVNLTLDNPNSGRIRDKVAQAKAGQLELKYDASGDDVKLSMTLTDNNIKYTGEDIPYNDQEVFIPLNLLKNDKGENYKGNELVRIRLEKIEGASNTFRVRVDRGFSPKATVLNQGHVNAVTPSYYTIGDVQVQLINPDNGIATGKFNYKNPDSNPKITNILRDGQEGYKVDDGRTIVEVNYLGGNTLEIIGTDFRKPVKIQIGEISINAEIEYQPEDQSISNRLIFKMPAVDKKYIGTYNRVVVENEDGGVANSEPIFIKFISPESTGLTITKITPNFGPTAGGTTVTIEGKDFREKIDGFPDGKLKVYFGDGSKQVQVPQENIISITYDKIIVKTPPYTAGPATVKVENPDGNIAELQNGFTYVSNPKIVSVVDPENNKKVIETLSVEGGEKVKIIGSDFMQGAKVVFNPVLKLVDDKTQGAGERITIDTKEYILESGTEGIEVEVINGQTITVITPPGKLDDKGIIVINPDKGASNVYNIGYGTPEIDAPLNVEAEVVFDQFIKVHWSAVKDAFEYEIYMSEDGGKFEFIGTTELTSYVVQNIKSRTEYQFLVRAIGKYGTSKPIDESKSNYVTTGRGVGPEDEDGSPGENTVINRNGTVADIIIGSEDFTSKGMTIDLTRGNLAGVKDITIRIPAEIVVNSFGNIKILGKDYTMEFSPNIFKNSTIESNKRNSDAGVVFKVFTYKGNVDIKSGDSVLGELYLLEANTYVGKDTAKIDYLNGNIGFTLDYDMQKAQARRSNRIQTVRYDDNAKVWMPINYPNRLGLYTVIGSRR